MYCTGHRSAMRELALWGNKILLYIKYIIIIINWIKYEYIRIKYVRPRMMVSSFYLSHVDVVVTFDVTHQLALASGVVVVVEADTHGDGV